jgi:hypothetical protein
MRSSCLRPKHIDVKKPALTSNLDAGVARPELREFAFDPIARVHGEREAYIAAAITMARAYRAAGRAANNVRPLAERQSRPSLKDEQKSGRNKRARAHASVRDKMLAAIRWSRAGRQKRLRRTVLSLRDNPINSVPHFGENFPDPLFAQQMTDPSANFLESRPFLHSTITTFGADAPNDNRP